MPENTSSKKKRSRRRPVDPRPSKRLKAVDPRPSKRSKAVDPQKSPNYQGGRVNLDSGSRFVTKSSRQRHIYSLLSRGYRRSNVDDLVDLLSIRKKPYSMPQEDAKSLAMDIESEAFDTVVRACPLSSTEANELYAKTLGRIFDEKRKAYLEARKKDDDDDEESSISVLSSHSSWFESDSDDSDHESVEQRHGHIYSLLTRGYRRSNVDDLVDLLSIRKKPYSMPQEDAKSLAMDIESEAFDTVVRARPLSSTEVNELYAKTLGRIFDEKRKAYLEARKKDDDDDDEESSSSHSRWFSDDSDHESVEQQQRHIYSFLTAGYRQTIVEDLVDRLFNAKKPYRMPQEEAKSLAMDIESEAFETVVRACPPSTTEVNKLYSQSLGRIFTEKRKAYLEARKKDDDDDDDDEESSSSHSRWFSDDSDHESAG